MEAEEGQTIQEETQEKRRLPKGVAHVLSSGAFNHQRGQLGSSSIPDPQGDWATPYYLAFSFLIWKREWVLHCTHPQPFITQPRAAAPRVPQLDLVARWLGFRAPLTSTAPTGGTAGINRCRILPQTPTLLVSSIIFAPQSPPNLPTRLAAAAGGSA